MKKTNGGRGKTEGGGVEKKPSPLMTVGYFMFGCVRTYKFRVTRGEFVPPPLLGGEGLHFRGDAAFFFVFFYWEGVRGEFFFFFSRNGSVRVC